MLKDGAIEALQASIRDMRNRSVREIRGMIRKIEDAQDERVRLEDAAYEAEKRAAANAQSPAAVEEPVVEKVAQPAPEQTEAKPARKPKSKQTVSKDAQAPVEAKKA